MPYPRETAGKGGHADFVRNPDVATFLESCTYLRTPSDEEAARIGSLFIPAPASLEPLLPRLVIASDASKSDTPINERLPSTQVGFLKVSHVLVDMQKYAGLVPPGGRFVDPFRAAEIHREAHPVTFTMPGSNVRYKGNVSVKDGFRQALFDHLGRVGSESGRGQSLLKTLRDLEVGPIGLNKCPSCQQAITVTFDSIEDKLPCPKCQASIYVSDSLRLHEGISDFGDNSSAMTRMMNAVEHLMLATFIKQVQLENSHQLADLSFVMDGPLAIFGEPAKLSQRLQRLVHEVNSDLLKRNLRPMLVLGLQKTGGLMDHAKLIEAHIKPGSLRVVDDTYRNDYVTGADSPADNFGNETYYGQDFLFRTEGGRIFNFAIPYPFRDKSHYEGGAGFAKAKVDLARYGSLIQQACDLIRHFEMDLYDSAIVPVALAHRHASISLTPGGRVLDLMVRTQLK
ncbi:hypothetical protein FHR51_000383 [Xanthomonas arboricola]|uniref:hypothetical protein n=1 Tax=Xanthomonas cannabis TaxID=1885674 RepID=UPI001609ECCB|nr:hypothetical protein [Xanthomonas cannabis]MBB3804272.1 hypothetical protein [Xanthomonas cannabis]